MSILGTIKTHLSWSNVLTTLLAVWFIPNGLLAIGYMNKVDFGEHDLVNSKNGKVWTFDRNGTYLAESSTEEEFLLEIVATGPIDRLIVSDDGRAPSEYHDFENLKIDDYLEISILKKFRLYASSVEHVRFRINYGREKMVSGSGPGNFQYVHKKVQDAGLWTPVRKSAPLRAKKYN